MVRNRPVQRAGPPPPTRLIGFSGEAQKGEVLVTTAGPRTPQRGDIVSAVFTVIAWVLLVPAALLLVLALLALLEGDGFSDAAPWWVVFAMAALVPGVPGMVLLVLVRVRRGDAARVLERQREAEARQGRGGTGEEP
jgi:hypothetical protein